MSKDQDKPSAPSDLSVQSEPPGADGVVDTPQQEEQAEAAEAGVDEFVDNTRALLEQSGHVLIFVWVAIVLVMSMPVLWKITQGYDLLQPFSFDMELAVLLVEFGCHAVAIALFTLSLPVGRAYLLGEGEGPKTFGEAWTVASNHLEDAVLIAVLYYVAVVVGLMLCIIPGLFAAVYLLPTLYLAAARGEPTLRALLKGSTQLGRHSNLYVFIVVGLGAVFIGTSVILGLVANHAGGIEEMAEMAAEPLSMIFFSLGFLVITVVLFLLYIATLGVFVTIEAAETGQKTRRKVS